MTDILLQTFVFLMAALVAVPVSKKLGLGSVLGYLVAGILIGPILGLVGGDESHKIQHVAEFGVVMMLFIVGLELEPKKLWELRHRLLGLGGLQVLVTSGLITAVALLLGLAWQTSLAIGLVLSLSSTAIVIQTLSEKGLIKSSGGQSSFSVLLFQDIAVIPMLALIPLLALPELTQVTHDAHDTHAQTNLLAGMSGSIKTLMTLGAIASIIAFGHFLVRPLFRIIAKTGLREMFTAFALCLVVGIGALMSVIGLSPALGTFLAGVVLADSEYRHELESTLEPFKGLLLGLFFITVGAGMNLGLLQQEFISILLVTLLVIAIKFAVLFALGLLFKLKGMYQWLFALSLAQAGEFGFVLLANTIKNHVIPTDIADKLLLVIALSMMLTPLLFIVFDKVIMPRQSQDEPEADTIDSHSSIIIAGNGRFGQIVNRVLMNSGFTPTVLDLNAEAISSFAKHGIKTFFGDASRAALLSAAKVDEATVFVVAVDNPEKAIAIVKVVRQLNPNLYIIARAYDRTHLYELYAAGANNIIRETFDSAVRASHGALVQLGIPTNKANEVTDIFFKRDRMAVEKLADLYDPSLPKFSNHAQFEAFLKINEETIDLIHKALGDDISDQLKLSDAEENQLDAKIVDASRGEE